MLGQGRGGVVGEVSSVAHNETTSCETRKVDLDVAEDKQSNARANSKSGDSFRPFPHILIIMLHVVADSGAADDNRLSQNENFQKIKWKVSNKTPVAMCVDSELVPSVFENTHTESPRLCAFRYVNESSG